MKNGKKKTYGIVGLGRFGKALALSLLQSKAEIMVIDKDEEKVKEMREYTENALVVKNLDKKTLAETGIQNCDTVVVCIGTHMDVSILTTLNLVSLGIKQVISKAASAEHGEILEKIGAEVVYPDRDMADRLAHRLEASNNTLDFITLTEKVNISKLLCPDDFVGKTVKEVNLRKNYNVNIITIESGRFVYEVVSPDYQFKAGDILFLSGSKSALNKISF